jgi:hypothetical protein
MLAVLPDVPTPVDPNPFKLTRLPEPAPEDGVVEMEMAAESLRGFPRVKKWQQIHTTLL